MDHAEIRHKVPDDIRRDEDVLTSTAFGLLEFIALEHALFPWLRQARNLEGEAFLIASEFSTVNYDYWPRFPELGDNTEMDLLLSISTRDREAELVGIEVKYLSGVSSFPVSGIISTEVRGQLGREWRVLSRMAPERAPGSPARISHRRLIYLTPETRMPRHTLKVMAAEVQEKDGGGALDMRRSLYWLSWLDLMPVIETACTIPNLHESELRAIERLRRILVARDLQSLSGIIAPSRIAPLAWSFWRLRLNWDLAQAPRVEWTYGAAMYDWAAPVVGPIASVYQKGE